MIYPMTSETVLPVHTLANLVEAGVDINAIAMFAGIAACPKQLPSQKIQESLQAKVQSLKFRQRL